MSDNPNDDSKGKDFDIGSLANFMGQYIRYDCFDELETMFMRLADQNPDGMKDEDVKKLAPWLSQAVDFAKNGLKVDLKELFAQHPEFKVQGISSFQRPVFQSMNNFSDANGEYYQSSKLLGKIYQKNIDTGFSVLNAVDNRGLQEVLATVWREKQKQLANFWKTKRKQNRKRVDHMIPEVSISYEDIDRRLEDAFLREELGRYRNYLKPQNIAESSEIDIFMTRRLDDYPRSHLRELVNNILHMLTENGLVLRTIDHDFMLGGYPSEDAEQVYKLFLYRACRVIPLLVTSTVIN